MDRPTDPELVERFRADLAKVWPQGGRLGVAVSGGPDSVALLLLADAALPGRVEAATVDHRLRSESADEAAMVARLCGDLGMPHEILAVDVKPGNLQASAREARYAALSRWAKDRGVDAIATAHHADDQAETLLMRLNRGSGLAGLAGVRLLANLHDATIVRPLLGWRKAELETVCSTAGLTAAFDPSNTNARFDRARLRLQLADADWLDLPALASSAGHLRDADLALVWAAEREWNERVETLEAGYRYRPLAPKAVRLRVLERAIAALGGRPRGGQVAQLEAALSAGKGGNLTGVWARSLGGAWELLPEPARRS